MSGRSRNNLWIGSDRFAFLQNSLCQTNGLGWAVSRYVVGNLLQVILELRMKYRLHICSAILAW